jgi:hypothetical protein
LNEQFSQQQHLTDTSMLTVEKELRDDSESFYKVRKLIVTEIGMAEHRKSVDQTSLKSRTLIIYYLGYAKLRKQGGINTIKQFGNLTLAHFNRESLDHRWVHEIEYAKITYWVQLKQPAFSLLPLLCGFAACWLR